MTASRRPVRTPTGSADDRLHYERTLLESGCRRIAGIDEAGRGPLAGPVIAAAVIFPPDWLLAGLPPDLRAVNDSKRLTPAVREQLYGLLLDHPAVECGVGRVDAPQIDAINILQATHKAMQLAVQALTPQPDHLLIDGRPVPPLTQPQTAIVKGDALSYSIAAASIVAKVTRDLWMQDQDRHFPGYGFAHHKGYGTAEHLAALQQLGPSPLHRRSFAPLKPAQGELFTDGGR